MKQKLRGNKLLLVLGIVLMISMCFIFLIQPVSAESAKLKLGDVNYEGSQNNCKYNVVISSNNINATTNTVNLKGIELNLVGVSCIRNIFTTYSYDITFFLYKEGDKEARHTKNIQFKISKASQVTEGDYSSHIIFESNQFETGVYTLVWSGTIRSNVVDNKAGSVRFNVD